MSAARGAGMKPALRSALVAVAFAGCGPSGFSQLGEFQLQFMNAGDSFSQAWLAYDSSQVGCKTLDQDFTATMNGSQAPVFRGAPDNHLFANTSCTFPSIAFPRPQTVEDSVLLVASAGGEQLTVQAQGIGFALTGVPLVTPGEVIHVGQRIQIQLGAGWELASWPAFGGVFMEGMGGPTTVEFAPPSAGGVLDVQLPSSLPPGEQHVLVNLTVTPTFSRCEGAPRGCGEFMMGLAAKLDVPFQVQP